MTLMNKFKAHTWSEFIPWVHPYFSNLHINYNTDTDKHLFYTREEGGVFSAFWCSKWYGLIITANLYVYMSKLFELHHENTSFCMGETKVADKLCS